MLMEYYLAEYAKVFADTDRDIWNYEDGCVLIGLNALWEATGEQQYFDSMRTFIDRYIDNDGQIRLYRKDDYNLDFIPSGRVLFPLYEQTGKEAYRLAAESLMNQLRSQPRTRTGSFWHKAIYPFQVWLDGLYMGLPFYSMYQRRFGSNDMADIVKQFTNAREVLYDRDERLYFHAYCETKDIFWCNKKTGLSPHFWTRSLGWLLMAFADVYEMLDDRHEREIVASLWQEAMDGMLMHLDRESNMFLQLTALPDEPGNYPETSGTLMVAYSLMKGARLKVWPDESYARYGVEILLAVEATQFRLQNGEVHLGGICKGAGLGPDGNFKRDGSAAYYLSEPVVEDEQKGVGVCMMAYAEYMRLCAAKSETGPKVDLFRQKYDPILPEEIARLKMEKTTKG